MLRQEDIQFLEDTEDLFKFLQNKGAFTIRDIKLKMKNPMVRIAMLSDEKGKEHLIYYMIGRDDVVIRTFPAKRESMSEIIKFYPEIVIVDTDTTQENLLKTLIISFQLSHDYVPIILTGKDKHKLYYFWQFGVFDIIDLNLQDKKADGIIDNAVRLKNMLTIQLEESLLDYLSRIADAKGVEDVTHSRRVAIYSLALAQAAGIHDIEFLRKLYLGAKYHDIGKIALPESILRKRGALYKNEYEVIKRHPLIGYYIVSHYGKLDYQIGDMVKHHHEWYNGSGYPDGLKGEEIPIGARIIAVVDAYDAITTDRPYRKKKSDDFAINELLKFKGIQFDPKLVDDFIRILALSN